MHFVFLRYFLDGFDSLERLKGYSGFELWIGSTAFGFHFGGCLVCFYPPSHHFSIAQPLARIPGSTSVAARQRKALMRINSLFLLSIVWG